MPLTLRLQEMEQAIATGGTIKHALRMTLQNEYIQYNKFIWPATATTSAGKGVVPYGARFRLKSTFEISGFSPIAQIILTQLKQYGLILADGGTGWASQIEYTRWPDACLAAFSEIYGANILPSNFEAVDESGLEISANSGATTKSETVVATGIKNPGHTARQQVVLTGVTLNLPRDYIYIQAGTPAQQLKAFRPRLNKQRDHLDDESRNGNPCKRRSLHSSGDHCEYCRNHHHCKKRCGFERVCDDVPISPAAGTNSREYRARMRVTKTRTAICGRGAL